MSDADPSPPTEADLAALSAVLRQVEGLLRAEQVIAAARVVDEALAMDRRLLGRMDRLLLGRTDIGSENRDALTSLHEALERLDGEVGTLTADQALAERVARSLIEAYRAALPR
jgi:hypothetical protein